MCYGLCNMGFRENRGRDTVYVLKAENNNNNDEISDNQVVEKWS